MATVDDNRESLHTPERLDVRFGVVAGGYVAALLSPLLVLVLVMRFQLRNELLALATLVAVGTVVAAVVARQVTRWGGLLAWFNASWLPWLVPAVGVIPMVAYFVRVIEYVGYTVSHLEAETAASLVGAVGFMFGFAACWLGGELVFMARNRLARTIVDDGHLDVEWTASWPRSQRFKYALGVLGVGGALFVLVTTRFGLLAGLFISILTLVPLIVVNKFSSERTYRVTPAGLERRLEKRGLNSRLFTPWCQFDGFTVTDRTIVLHRHWPDLDVRFSRRDISLNEEEAVVSALAAQLDRRNP